MAEQFKVEGLAELELALNELPKSLARSTLLRTLKKEAQPIADLASQLAPDDPLTGGKDLKSSILVRSVRAKERTNHVEVAVGPSQKVFYGMFTEWGSAHISPKPFMRPAFDASVRKVLTGIRVTLAIEIEKTRKRLARKAERLAAQMKVT